MTQGWVECVGHADRACFDLTCHMKRTGVDLDVYEPYETPKIVDVLEAKINKGAIGKEFRKDATDITNAVEKMDEEQLEKLRSALETGSGNIEVML